MSPSPQHRPPQQQQRQFDLPRFRQQVKSFFRLCIEFARSHCHFTIILLVTIILIIISVVLYLLPQTLSFEGNLVVEELGFTTTEIQPLIDKVQIKELMIRGQQTYVFQGIKGEFESATASQVKELDKLTISVNSEDSSLTVKPVSNKNHFQLSQLNLPANTQVNQLRYEPTSLLQLAFSLPESLPNNLLRPLALNLGVSMQITISGNYKVTELQQQGSGTFTFTTPPLGNFKPPLPTQTLLRIKLHGTEQDVFFGNHMVKQVQFAKEERLLTGEGYSYNRSSIHSGVIRIANQTITVEKNQFIKFGAHNCAERDGCEEIQKIPYMRVIHEELGNLQVTEQKVQVSEPNYGLEVGFSGKTSHFEVGINPNLPIKIIQGNYMSLIPSDIANFLIIMFTSIFSGLFTWILTNLPQKTNP